ncbi:MAG: ABC transporter permease [Vampirovibrionales bacterium]|nr:ABC transporter permease [Vampirovibrionales bacterium]
MLQWFLKRLLIAIPTLVLVSVVGFTLMRYHFTLGPLTLGTHRVIPRIELKHPIDPLATLRQNPQITPEALKKEEHRLGLNQPMTTQYWRWLSSLVAVEPKLLQTAFKTGDFSGALQPSLGKTLNGEDVSRVLGQRAGNTILLNLLAIAISWGVAIPLGVWAANRHNSVFDKSLSVASALGLSIPGFVMALLLAIVAVKTRWFPLGGLHSDLAESWPLWRQMLDTLWHLLLPALVLSVGGIASLHRQMRANMLDVTHADYVRMATAHGLTPQTVLFKHALRNAINPMITLFGFELAGLLSGAVLVETVLGFPGLGALTYQAAMQGDVNLVMASLILSSVLLVLGNVLADALLMLVDPRIRA